MVIEGVSPLILIASEDPSPPVVSLEIVPTVATTTAAATRIRSTLFGDVTRSSFGLDSFAYRRSHNCRLILIENLPIRSRDLFAAPHGNLVFEIGRRRRRFSNGNLFEDKSRKVMRHDHTSLRRKPADRSDRRRFRTPLTDIFTSPAVASSVIPST